MASKKPINGKLFSKEYQPTFEARSKGQKRRAFMEKLLTTDIGESQLRREAKQLLDYMGIEMDIITVEDIMHLVQVNKAIVKQDTIAYEKALDRLIGKPKQQLEIRPEMPPPILDTNGLLDDENKELIE